MELIGDSRNIGQPLTSDKLKKRFPNITPTDPEYAVQIARSVAGRMTFNFG